jgi:hypothetical protein
MYSWAPLLKRTDEVATSAEGVSSTNNGGGTPPSAVGYSCSPQQCWLALTIAGSSGGDNPLQMTTWRAVYLPTNDQRRTSNVGAHPWYLCFMADTAVLRSHYIGLLVECIGYRASNDNRMLDDKLKKGLKRNGYILVVNFLSTCAQNQKKKKYDKPQSTQSKWNSNQWILIVDLDNGVYEFDTLIINNE